MATFTRQVGIAFGTQSVEGTADATISALAGALDLDDGIILGDSDSGVVGSGVTHSFERRFREKGTVSGGFTLLASDFLEEVVTLSFAFPLAGPRTTTTTPVDADFEHQKGIKALLAACGLAGSASASNPTVGWKYVPASVSIATAKIFDSGFAWVIRDIRGNWSLTQEPGEIGIMTCELSGIVDSEVNVAFPTFDYEEQASISAPSVSGVSPSWGLSDEQRGWTTLTISCENQIESIPDSASSTGSSFEQTGREISVSMTIKDTSTDPDFTRTQLVRPSAPVASVKATVGTPAGTAESAIAYQWELSLLEIHTFAPDVAGTKAASTLTGRCTGTTDGSEFFLAFL